VFVCFSVGRYFVVGIGVWDLGCLFRLVVLVVGLCLVRFVCFVLV